MAGAIVRLRSSASAAAVGGIRQLASSAVGLMLPPDKVYWLGEKKVVKMNIDEKELEWDRVVGSSHGWVGLMKLEEDRARCGSSSGVSLWNPMSGARMKLPPIHTIIRGHPSCQKLMVDDSECSRAIIVGSSQWLGVCWPGRCSEWTRFGVREYIADAVVACSRSRVFTVSYDWELVRWDVSDPRRPRREWKKDMKNPGHLVGDKTRLHLVYAEESGQLFLLTRHVVLMEDIGAVNWHAEPYPEKTVAFDVHLVLENETLDDHAMEHSLSGLVMFVGNNNSFAVAAADFPDLKPDSIYFTDHPDHLPCRSYDCQCPDVGIYDYKNRTISSCYYPAHRQGVKTIDPHPFWLTGS